MRDIRPLADVAVNRLYVLHYGEFRHTINTDNQGLNGIGRRLINKGLRVAYSQKRLLCFRFPSNFPSGLLSPLRRLELVNPRKASLDVDETERLIDLNPGFDLVKDALPVCYDH